MGLAEKMAGEIVLSDNPGETLKKWRKNFEISQIEISKHLGVSPSVISDYEGGRRSSPGISVVRKIVEALLGIDERNGGMHIRGYENILTDTHYQDIILDIREYRTPVVLEEFSNRIGAQKIAGNFERTIQGYTLVDSIKAILHWHFPRGDNTWLGKVSGDRCRSSGCHHIGHKGTSKSYPLIYLLTLQNNSGNTWLGDGYSDFRVI